MNLAAQDAEFSEGLIDSHHGPCSGDTADVAGCPFCARIAAAASTEPRPRSRSDAFPVSDEHMLVVPRRHVERIEDLSTDEWTELFALVQEICQELAARTRGCGLNVGVNNGEAAGQTVDHAHVHVIPRRSGDVLIPAAAFAM